MMIRKMMIRKMMIRKLSLTLPAFVLFCAFGTQKPGSADRKFELSNSELSNIEAPSVEVPSVEAPNDEIIRSSLSIVVKPSTAQDQDKDGKLHFTVELINRVGSPITWKSGTNPPFDIRVYTLNGQRLGPPRPERIETLERRGGPKDPVFEITLKPLEKKIYTVEYPMSERLVGTYKVSVAMPLFKYTIGGESFALKNVVLIHSNEPSILVENGATTVQGNAGQPSPSQTLVPVEVASVTPSRLSWSLGEALQPKAVRIKLKGTEGRALVGTKDQSRLFTSKVLRGMGQEGVYEVTVTPISTRDAVAEVLQVEGASVPIDIDVVVGQPQAAIPTTPLAPTNDVGAPVARPAEADAPAEVDAPLKVGQIAPDFSVIDMNGQKQTLSALRGKKNLLLTFFPKCFTGGCTNHLSSLRDVYPQLQAADIEVLAVSVDSAEGEKGQLAFAKRWALPFPLIPDTERELSILYNAARFRDDFASRMTYLIDKRGIIRSIDVNVNVDTHGPDTLAKAKQLLPNG